MVRFFWASGLGVQNHLVFKPEDSSYNQPLAVIKFINSFKWNMGKNWCSWIYLKHLIDYDMKAFV